MLAASTLPTVEILNLPIHRVAFHTLVEELREGVVFTANVDHLMKVQSDQRFYEDYLAADFRLCDSRIVQWASGWVSDSPIEEQVAGSDLFPAFCRHHAVHPELDQRIFLLGSTPIRLERITQEMNDLAGRKLIVGAYSPPFGFEHDDAEKKHICELIAQSGAHTLAVGVGAPKQERWIMENRAHLPQVKLFFAIGATLDFMSGDLQRAPSWVSNMGLEWAWRMMQEPTRLVKRYLVDDLPFFSLIAKQRQGTYRNPWGQEAP
ncbi:WecB/TagA/CpsF family glycosyltransferase [Pontibacter sp. G13]|uniref:WecB/TagA/CpsF family glycosyltransferase n=1 Tax=Pontibacter sp. G13 TaxID=3074898 RepID=UPI00288BF3DD|nr:WecB/TagA/CpsF family glycosyltransferase [Pontibacter sp. G13]WNJ19002.1 WecB/TagA/CpsF family glycosyltransferase [Pontibacter sp. G13]